jgi:hypothetical protein
MAQKGGNDNSVDPAAFIVIPLGLLVLMGVFWMMNKHGLYYGAGKMAYYMLWPFSFIPGVDAYRSGVVTSILTEAPDAGLTASWANAAWRAPALLLGLLCLKMAYNGFNHPIKRMKGKLSVDALLRHQASIHSPIAPIVPIAKDMHKNLDPRFHEPFHPHEVVANEGFLNPDLKTLDREKMENYFIRQLGTRVYRPGLDSPDIVFADRLNDYEKAIFAMLAPLAIKIKDGLPEYNKLCDALNYSAVNSTQTPDLRLANELYQAYRTHPKLNNLFRRHHFSTTYLMQLYILAKRAGKIATSHWVGWLRPNANSLYAALNCAGRETPFTEAAGAFNHWRFEIKCGKENMMPVLPVVVGAMVGLQDEWDFWRDADQRETEETLWGKMDGKEGSDHDLFRRYVSEVLTAKQGFVPQAGDDNIFDQNESAARRLQEEKDLSAMMSGVSQSLPKRQE